MASTFIWYELLTSDPDAAAAFYGAVLGWTANGSGQEGIDYRILNMHGVAVGGLMALPPGAAEAGMRPGWLGYLSVADVDRSVANIVAAGGAEQMPAMDIAGVGRIAMGAYLLFGFGSGDAVGGMFNDPEAQRPYWLYYFNVDGIETASKRVTSSGGVTMSDPHEVPTGDWIVQARDPQGAMFALVGPAEGKRR
jgi:hypothetical protein